MSTQWIWTLAGVLALSSLLLAADGFVVVVNRANPTVAMSQADLQDLFLGKKTTLPGGGAAVVVLMEGGAAHNAFLSGLVKKNSSQFDSYWKKVIFTGTGASPRYVKGEAEMLEAVKGNVNAIGYLAKDDAAVKTVAIK
ncbi:MAG TPA: ABC transporter substrate-binding protein [Candidatus Aminicenantes bacterium]|nr:ABC transporter substrate-binding protein [Candidatus Aminicenantes bacterium]